jgi:replication fork clamp-binding protein CrfC
MADKTEVKSEDSWWDKFKWLASTSVDAYGKSLDAKNDAKLQERVSDYIAEQTMKKQEAGYLTLGNYSIKITDALLLIGGTLGLLLIARSAKALIK